MEELYEVIIIGGGVMGSATAYYLAKEYGNKVLLLEQFDFLHKRGSSHGETRTTSVKVLHQKVRPQGLHGPNRLFGVINSKLIRATYAEDHYTLLMKDAFKFWSEAEMEYGSKVYTCTGGLDISKTDNEHFQAIIRSANKNNVSIQHLSPEQVSVRFPPITLPEGYVALYNPDGGVICATKSVAMFQSMARMNGAQLRDNSPVEKIEEMKSEDRIIVRTKGGQSFKTKKVIVTSGPWTKKLMKQSPGLDLPLTHLLSTFSYWKVNDPEAYSSDRFPAFIIHGEEEGHGAFPLREYPNMIKCATFFGVPCDPDKREFGPGDGSTEKNLSVSLQTFLTGVAKEPTMVESCIYTMTPDEGFIIDRIPSNPNILIGCGFSGHGFKLAPVVGKFLTEMAVNGRFLYPDLEQHFKLDRFH